MQTQALDMAKNYESEALERIRRMNLAAAGLEVRGPSRKGMAGAGNMSGLGEIFGDDSQRVAGMMDEEVPA